MDYKIIAIGPTTQNNKSVNGQSMMFQLLVDELEKRKIKNKIIDIGVSIFTSERERISGKFSFIKAINYLIVVIRIFFILMLNKKCTIYLTTAQSKVGFIRDYLIIGMGRMFNHNIVAHQFGANYGGFYNNQSKSLQNRINNTLSKTNKIIVEGEFTKSQFSFLRDYKSKVYALPNGLPEKIDSSKIHSKSISKEDSIKILYLSNLIESKGFWDVLEAVKIIEKTTNLKIEATFAGRFLESVDDTKFVNSELSEKAFFEYVQAHDLKKNVSHVKGLYGKEKSEAFQKSHFFILPSYYINEGQPVSVLEALAYGCVPIVTEYRLIPTMVNQENGIFVNPKSPAEIAEVIKKLAQDETKYEAYSKAAINSYLNNFTADKYTEHLISLL